ncbi:hypothetical protein GCM10009006_36890 [Haloarcula argentinensis]|uniref:Uncharacterized protein n=1 Tax=Haloarcula argentinensis TaxID=43776 RepID=A0A830FX10_HALAR|nr:hypothetical protein GCM10009006_36890 [Haloarcula argentinensis]
MNACVTTAPFALTYGQVAPTATVPVVTAAPKVSVSESRAAIEKVPGVCLILFTLRKD